VVGVRRVAWVSVVLRSGCLALPFIVPVSYKMDYDQGVSKEGLAFISCRSAYSAQPALPARSPLSPHLLAHLLGDG